MELQEAIKTALELSMGVNLETVCKDPFVYRTPSATYTNQIEVTVQANNPYRVEIIETPYEQFSSAGAAINTKLYADTLMILLQTG